MRIFKLILLLGIAALTGCSSLSSRPATEAKDGLIYYLPKKDIRVTVVREGAKTTVTIGTTSAFADYKKSFILDFEKSLLARTELKVGVSTAGLLTSTKSVTTPGIGEALKSLASAKGAMRGLAFAPPKEPDCAEGTTTHVYALPLKRAVGDNPCGLTVTITSLSEGLVKQDAPALKQADASGYGASGVFYRQDLPYLVRVAGAGVDSSDIVLSPSESPVRFLPVARAMFAVNTSDFAFTDGVPTKFDQDTDGEIVAALKIPADVIGAYFAAIGKAFTDRKTVAENETAAVAAQLELELAKIKFKECIDAIKKGDDALVQTLGCGK
ncbi:hypothetical protein [Roseateles noduli]|uniref:hypothetical protein n=1 Tax=Roseateles noduli TaxID=2052484 RepID=UPI003D6608F2